MDTLISSLLDIPYEAVHHCRDDLVFLVGWELCEEHDDMLTDAGFDVNTSGTFEFRGLGFPMTLITATKAMRDSGRPY